MTSVRVYWKVCRTLQINIYHEMVEVYRDLDEKTYTRPVTTLKNGHIWHSRRLWLPAGHSARRREMGLPICREASNSIESVLSKLTEQDIYKNEKKKSIVLATSATCNTSESFFFVRV